MASGRTPFATEFLLRELLAALGNPLHAPFTNNARNDSFSESLSEETESQRALKATNGDKSRVMLVRHTNASQQTVTLVDRAYDVEAFIPNTVILDLTKKGGYHTLGKLRGSVVRVTKYHFATLTRCLAATQPSRKTSVLNVIRNKARVYLYVEALSVVEVNDLAVNALPQVYTHPVVAKRLHALSDAELEKQLMINQGLPPLETTWSGRFGDDRPLLEEDCEIPEEQEQELDEQDEWGPPTTVKRHSTGSALIEEKGSMLIPELQAARDPTLSDNLLFTQESMTSSGDLSVASVNLSVTMSENSSITLSDETSMTPSLNDHGHVFRQENIRETFVVGSDSESSGTDSEHGRAQRGKKSKSGMLKLHEQANSSRSHSFVHSSQTPTIPKTTQSSWVTVDLTDDSPQKAPMAVPACKKKTIEELEVETEANDLQNEAGGNAAPSPSGHKHCPTEKQSPSAGWTTSLLRLVSLSTSAAKALLPRTQSPAKKAGENDQNTTRILNWTEETENEAKFAQPEDLVSSQATQYEADNDDDDHAFEYEDMLSDDIVPPRSAERRGDQAQEADSAGDLSLAEKGAEAALTPKRRPAKKENMTSTDCITPSSSAQAATPGTEERSQPTDCQIPALMNNRKENTEMPARDSSHPVSPLSPNDSVVPIDPAAHRLLVKSPSEQAVSIGRSSSRTGFSAIESRGIKRRRQQTHAPSVAIQAKHPVSHPRVQKNTQLRSETQKRQRELLARMAGSLSPQFEPASFPRRPLQSAHGNGGTDSYSLKALGTSLGTHKRDLTSKENDPLRQPRRAWKQYENLFPPLNMTHLKHTMAEDKAK